MKVLQKVRFFLTTSDNVSLFTNTNRQHWQTPKFAENDINSIPPAEKFLQQNKFTEKKKKKLIRKTRKKQ